MMKNNLTQGRWYKMSLNINKMISLKCRHLIRPTITWKNILTIVRRAAVKSLKWYLHTLRVKHIWGTANLITHHNSSSNINSIDKIFASLNNYSPLWFPIPNPPEYPNNPTQTWLSTSCKSRWKFRGRKLLISNSNWRTNRFKSWMSKKNIIDYWDSSRMYKWSLKTICNGFFNPLSRKVS